MATLMFSSSNSASTGFHISYEEVNDLATDYYTLAKQLGTHRGYGEIKERHDEIFSSFMSEESHPAVTRLGTPSRISAAYIGAMTAGDTAWSLGHALAEVYNQCVKAERAIEEKEYNAAGSLAQRPSGFENESHAESFYEAAAAAEAQRKKEEEEAAAAAAATAAAAAAAAAEQQAIDDYVREHWPELWAEIEEKRKRAEEDEWLAGVKEKDPELYEAIMAERKRQEEARKAAEEAEAALAAELAAAGEELGSDFGSSSLGSDFGDSSFDMDDSGFGGGGGGGGGGDLGSFDDWSNDLLSDTIDGEELGAAGEALDDIASTSTDAASARGTGAIDDAADLASEGGFFAQYGDQLASFAHAYGLQAAAVIGGGVALYATRGQTTEAVAHVAEFVTTKCKPFASDVVDQVKGAAKKTRVNLSNTKSKIVGVTRGEEAGDLIG